MCLARSMSSEFPSFEVKGGSPDFESSPEVLTCNKTLSGEDSRSAGRARFIASADFSDESVCNVYRFGIAGKCWVIN